MAEIKTNILSRADEGFKSPECRFSYLNSMYEKRDNKYGCSLIFDKSHKAALEAELIKVAKAAWGDKAVEKIKNGMVANPFLDGESKQARSKETGELHAGMGPNVFFIRVNTMLEPTIRYRSQHEAPKLGNGPNDVKSGDYGFAVLRPYAWNRSDSGDGISFGIEYLQKTRDGESLGGTGGVDVSKYYEKVADSGPAPESTKTGDGASGLFG